MNAPLQGAVQCFGSGHGTNAGGRGWFALVLYAGVRRDGGMTVAKVNHFNRLFPAVEIIERERLMPRPDFPAHECVAWLWNRALFPQARHHGVQAKGTAGKISQ